MLSTNRNNKYFVLSKDKPIKKIIIYDLAKENNIRCFPAAWYSLLNVLYTRESDVYKRQLDVRIRIYVYVL